MDHVVHGLGAAASPHSIGEHLSSRLRAAFPPVGLLGDTDARAMRQRIGALLERIDRVATAEACLSVRLDAVEREAPPMQGSPK